MKSLQELANDGILFNASETELVKQNLFNIIKDASVKSVVGRNVVQVVPMTQGSTLDWVLADKTSTIVRKVAEGAEIPIDVESYTKVSVTPEKYGVRLAITKEMIEDANWPLIERNLKEAGRQMAYKEDGIIFDAFNDGTTGFAAQSGHAFNSASTELGISDIVEGMRLVEIQDYQPNTMICHPTQLAELRQIDTFVEADKVGDRSTFEKGWAGKVFGLDTVFSTILTANRVHVLDKNEAGVLVVRRPLTVENWREPLRDLENASVTQRMAARVLRAGAGVTISVQ